MGILLRYGFPLSSPYLTHIYKMNKLTIPKQCLKDLCALTTFLNANSDVFLGYAGWAAGGFAQSYELNEVPVLSNGKWTDQEIVTQCIVGTWGNSTGSNSTSPGGSNSTSPYGSNSTSSNSTSGWGSNSTSNYTSQWGSLTSRKAKTAPRQIRGARWFY